MQRVMLLALIVGTACFDLFVLWAVGFTAAWGGNPTLRDFGFWLFAASPLVVTAYCIHKVRSFRRGENPRL